MNSCTVLKNKVGDQFDKVDNIINVEGCFWKRVMDGNLENFAERFLALLQNFKVSMRPKNNEQIERFVRFLIDEETLY